MFYILTAVAIDIYNANMDQVCFGLFQPIFCLSLAIFLDQLKTTDVEYHVIMGYSMLCHVM